MTAFAVSGVLLSTETLADVDAFADAFIKALAARDEAMTSDDGSDSSEASSGTDESESENSSDGESTESDDPSVGDGPATDRPFSASEIATFISDYRALEGEASRLRGSATISAKSDSAGEASKTEAEAAVSLTAGRYPNELRVSVETDLRFSDDELTEELSEMTVNFDHYFSETREGFAFLQRSSNSFLGVDRRYHLGFGMEWEFTPRSDGRPGRRRNGEEESQLCSESSDENGCFSRFTVEGAKLLSQANSLLARRARAQLGLQNLMAEAMSDEALDELLSDTDILNLREHVAKQYAKTEVGIALSLFADIEDPDPITTMILDANGVPVMEDGTDEFSLAPASRDRVRMSIRPSFVWRPSDVIEIRGDVYYHLAIDEPKKFRSNLPNQSLNGRRDYRIDATFSMTWDLASGDNDSGLEPKLEFRYDWNKNNVPPNLSNLIADRLDLDGDGIPEQSFTNFSARETHRKFSMGVKVEF